MPPRRRCGSTQAARQWHASLSAPRSTPPPLAALPPTRPNAHPEAPALQSWARAFRRRASSTRCARSWPRRRPASPSSKWQAVPVEGQPRITSKVCLLHRQKKTSKGRELARLRESKTRPSLHEGSVGGMGRGGVNPSLEALVRGHVSAAKKQTHTHECLRHSFAHVSFTRLLFFHAAQVFHFSTQTTHSSHMSHTPFPHISEFDSLFPRGPLRRLFLSVCV